MPKEIPGALTVSILNDLTGREVALAHELTFRR